MYSLALLALIGCEGLLWTKVIVKINARQIEDERMRYMLKLKKKSTISWEFIKSRRWRNGYKTKSVDERRKSFEWRKTLLNIYQLSSLFFSLFLFFLLCIFSSLCLSGWRSRALPLHHRKWENRERERERWVFTSMIMMICLICHYFSLLFKEKSSHWPRRSLTISSIFHWRKRSRRKEYSIGNELIDKFRSLE